MSKKLFLITGLLIAFVFTFSVTFSFATDNNNEKNMVNDAVNGVRGAVDGAENAVEGAVKDISNGSKNMTKNMEDGANNMMNNKNNNDRNNDNNMLNNNNGMGTTNNGNYTTARTATTGIAADAGATFLGMNATAWTWLILGIAALAIIALVWYYSNQVTNTRYNDHGE
ncbi:MAG: hypothetical protein HFJ55_04785 [Clostridia bacterium]|nr:hypothetical protein [Clostridia bacterium]